ncbi:MAG: hypothetical protein AOA65_1054 [Candidatus Bathyarchaeota archaeon BA1]|nr:MAG: hypothetical protein AOA65_1054 [Candidatus Bathyarchaeota archaeon BA1]
MFELKKMGLEKEILKVIEEMGHTGVTAGQIARILGKSRESISHYLWILSKSGKVERISKNLWVLKSSIGVKDDPFNIPFDRFMELSLEEHRGLQENAYNVCKPLLMEAFNRRGARHVVICDSKILYETKDPVDISAELILELLRKLQKPCYVFTSEDMVEESPWFPLNAKDYYPTVRIHLGTYGWGNERVFGEGQRVDADFDTGNPFYKIFDDALGRKFLKHPEAYEVRLGRHIGFAYRFYVRKVKIGVKDVNGVRRCLETLARFVLSWEKSPLCLANPNRQGFLGRDLMLQLPLRLELDPIEKKTVLKLV